MECSRMWSRHQATTYYDFFTLNTIIVLVRTSAHYSEDNLTKATKNESCIWVCVWSYSDLSFQLRAAVNFTRYGTGMRHSRISANMEPCKTSPAVKQARELWGIVAKKRLLKNPQKFNTETACQRGCQEDTKSWLQHSKSWLQHKSCMPVLKNQRTTSRPPWVVVWCERSVKIKSVETTKINQN